jgi:Tfp pilus assembly protein PilZ
MHYNDVSCSGQLCDISTGGCFVKTPYTYPIGADVHLLLGIAGTQLELNARVVRIIPQTGVGVAFQGLSTEQEKVLAWIVADAKPAGPLAATQPAGTPQPATAPLPVSRDAELLDMITKRVNEQGVLTRQELTDLVNSNR